MQRHDNTALNGWIATTRSRPDATMRLFCFSYAGAGSSAYRGWADAASNAIEVYTVQLPGRENRIRETPVASLAELIPSISAAIRPLLDRPFAFFGHSLGALLSFETARELRRTGAAMPVALFSSASRAPQLPWPHPPVRHLDDVGLLTEVNRRYGSVPSVILEDAELRELLTPALRADMSLVETYRYENESPFAMPLVVFGGNADPMVNQDALLEWKSQTTGLFRHRMVTGDHLFLQTNRQTLLDDIEATLLASRVSAPSAV